MDSNNINFNSLSEVILSNDNMASARNHTPQILKNNLDSREYNKGDFLRIQT